MKIGFYPKLAFSGIRKNGRLYIPYIMTCVGMVMMFYIITFMLYSPAIKSLPGSAMITEVLGLGSWVIAIFSGIFLFYTNSFLIRRRKKEFGLYNILGMSRLNLSMIVFWETVIIGAMALIIGLFLGILFSKLFELGLVNIIDGEIPYSFSISSEAIIRAVYVFGVIFVLLLINSVRQIRFSTAINLLKSESVGEKPPKANWLFGIFGIVILGAAYFIAVSIKDAVSALAVFFIAVIMVIGATYLIMISGSVMLCRLLQKSKAYYYRTNHFVSVSSMVYRMKRNGAGLASICILATMVLVMISSTASLYFGGEESLMNRYPREINWSFRMDGVDALRPENISALRDELNSIIAESGVTPSNITDYRSVGVAGVVTDGTVELDVRNYDPLDTSLQGSGLFEFYFIPLSDYNAATGSNVTLNDGEALIYVYRDKYERNTIAFNGGKSFDIVGQVDDFHPDGDAEMSIVSTMYLFVPNLESAVEGIDTLADFNGDRMIVSRWVYGFDTDVSPEEQSRLNAVIWKTTGGENLSAFKEKFSVQNRTMECREDDRQEFYALYGGLFFLGILLSIVFIFGTILIIYYKQISEGYEDQKRFEIMQKVGMTDREIRKSINSQLLTVFFLPLVFACSHLAFAFPLIRKILLLFNLQNVWVFASATVLCFVVFAVFYTIVYKLTSNAYYNIVSGAKEAGK